MHIHILGICGTFMGGVAQLARAAGIVSPAATPASIRR
jgi:UDP-N-acetylmuramate-alanine ligase